VRWWWHIYYQHNIVFYYGTFRCAFYSFRDICVLFYSGDIFFGILDFRISLAILWMQVSLTTRGYSMHEYHLIPLAAVVVTAGAGGGED
jgi:hypothetical protein